MYENFEFQFPWRPYQSRILANWQNELNDGKYHLVAAPGAGKTILGIEFLRQLNEKALILSPTKAIREQWVEKLRHFVKDASVLEENVSKDIIKVTWFNSITYQSLYSFSKKINQLSDYLYQNEVKVILLDEAHHLNDKWWKILYDVQIALAKDIIFLSLTATPPYDLEPQKWDNYQKLCGPISDEISIPELVKEKVLCPHQDYLITSEYTTQEIKNLSNETAKKNHLKESISYHPQVIEILMKQSHFIEPASELKFFIKNFDLFEALLNLYKQVLGEFPKGMKKLAYRNKLKIESYQLRHFQQLLEYLLQYKKLNNLTTTDVKHIKNISKQLKEEGYLVRNKVKITDSFLNRSKASFSNKKIYSCLQIYLTESINKSSNLRQVILTDFINLEHLSNISEEPSLSACSIFKEILISEKNKEERAKIVMITGNHIALHTSFNTDELSRKELNNAFLQTIDFKLLEADSGSSISFMTNHLINGSFRCVISTRSLLGEGWDAPCVNSIILACNTSTSVSANQMRGRALRVDPKFKNKHANIFHLISAPTENIYLSLDFPFIAKRFTTFQGLHYNKDVIESGLDRLSIKANPDKNDKYSSHDVNQLTYAQLKNQTELSMRWQNSIFENNEGEITPFTRLNKKLRFSFFSYSKSSILLGSLCSLYFMIFYAIISFDLPKIPQLLVLIFITIILTKCSKKIIFKHTRIISCSYSRKNFYFYLAKAIIDSLVETKEIKTNRRKLKIKISKTNETEDYQIGLLGGTLREKNIFTTCISELFQTTQQPRYIINFLKDSKINPHNKICVPTHFGKNANQAKIFAMNISKHLFPCELIYTKSENGLKELLSLKIEHELNNKMPAECIEKWTEK